MSNPKKPRSEELERARHLSREEIERRLGHVAADLLTEQDPGREEAADARPAWIAPRQLVRILAPFLSMN